MKAVNEKSLSKEFSFCTCQFEHNSKSKVLLISYLRSGKVFFRVTVPNFKKSVVKRFYQQFNEFNARELFNFNITLL